MLDPRDRQLLLEALRPPDGYQFDQAIGTSYSLDLLALLTAPLAFTFFDWEDEADRLTEDPLALLESVRRHAARIHLFCQAGETKLPPFNQRLIAYLERSVIPVRAPHPDGIFHPKVWLVRYVMEGEATRYRFICLTRNLTFDRCWDSILTMDGELLERKNALSANHPLGDFIKALPTLALRPVDEAASSAVAVMAAEVRRVAFELPDGAEGYAFWPMGIPGYSRSPFHRDRASRPLLVMAPFASENRLERLVAERKTCFLISLPDQLSKLSPELIAKFKDIYILNAAAEDPAEDSDQPADLAPSGLHAKLFVEDDGWNAHMYTGSANATHAAFERNVEFVVELTGKKAQLGIDTFLGTESTKGEGLRPLLERWTIDQREGSDEALIGEELEFLLAGFRRQFAAHGFGLRCVLDEEELTRYRLELSAASPVPRLEGASLRCWPASLPSNYAVVPSGEGLVASFGPVGVEALSGFLAFELSATKGAVRRTCQFVVNMPLLGAPADRMKRLLASHLSDKGQLLRFLLMLLETAGAAQGMAASVKALSENGLNGVGESEAPPLFERLVKSLVDAPKSVANACAMIEELAATPEGRAVVAPQLLQLWAEVKLCLAEMHDESRPA